MHTQSAWWSAVCFVLCLQMLPVALTGETGGGEGTGQAGLLTPGDAWDCLSGVPVWVWVLPVIVTVTIDELCKRTDRREHRRVLFRQRILFDTKLGMKSPEPVRAHQ
jgi:hypothetical protein